MLAGAGTRKSSRDANNVAIAGLKGLGEVDLVAWGVLDKDVEAGNLLADSNHSSGRGVEATGSKRRAGEGDTTERSTERHD